VTRIAASSVGDKTVVRARSRSITTASFATAHPYVRERSSGRCVSDLGESRPRALGHRSILADPRDPAEVALAERVRAEFDPQGVLV